MTAAQKMTAARTALVLDEPFFGTLALKLIMVPDPTCKTLWVDGVSLGYSPDYVDSLDFEETKAGICHEVMHCACGHPWRKGGREHKRYNKACDYAINPIVRDAGFKLPDNVLLDDDWAGFSVEWIFDRLPPELGDGGGESGDGDGDGTDDESGTDPGSSDDDSPDGADDASGTGPGDDDPQDGTDDESGTEDNPGGMGEVRDAPTGEDAPQEGTEEDWKRSVEEAARAAESRGNLPGHLQRFAEESRRTKTDWRAVLHRFAQEIAESDYSWTRPNPRHMVRGIYLPSLRSENEMGPVVFGVDTSMSVDAVLLAQFTAEMNSVVDDVQPLRVHVMYCDAQIHRVDTFERGETIETEFLGGGGTDFRPVFKAVDDLDEPPAAIIYLTDLYGVFPDEPAIPTLWACPNTQVAPFGETVRIEL